MLENTDHMAGLQVWGWSPYWQSLFEASGLSTLHPARVVRQDRGLYRVQTREGERSATLSGKFRQGPGSHPAVGDWVLAAPADAFSVVVHHLLPRSTELRRKAAGEGGDDQILAANVDTVFVVAGLDHDFNARRLERYVTMIWNSGAMPAILLNKADIVPDLEPFLEAVHGCAPGVPVHALSAATGAGLEGLGEYLRHGKTVAVVGSSGVGKSTLLNALLGQARQDTQAVRDDDSRGRHTTTHRELFLLPMGALLLDTPGLRELQLSADQDALEQTFADVRAFAEACHFADCSHESEPGCAVQAALARGELSAERFASYTKLQREIQYEQRKSDLHAQQAEQAKWKAIHKEQKRLQRDREQQYRRRF